MGTRALLALARLMGAGMTALRQNGSRREGQRLPPIEFTEADLFELLPGWAWPAITVQEADDFALGLLTASDEVVGELAAEGYRP